MGLFSREKDQPEQPEQPFQAPMPFDIQDQSGGMSIPMLAQQNADLIRWQLELGDITDDIEHFLKGEFKSEGEWKKGGKPLMNAEGIKSFVTLLRSRMHKGMILSNLEREDIRRMMHDIEYEIIGFIYLNAERYEIGYESFDTICNLTTQNCFATFRRAKDGQTQKILGTIQKRLEQVVSNTSGGNRRGRSTLKQMFGMNPEQG